jgi:hypothetical protein
MSIDKENLTPFDIPMAIPQVDLPLPQGFDLRPKQGDPSLVRLFNKVVMKCLFVLTNQLFSHIVISFYIKRQFKSTAPTCPPLLVGGNEGEGVLIHTHPHPSPLPSRERGKCNGIKVFSWNVFVKN